MTYDLHRTCLPEREPSGHLRTRIYAQLAPPPYLQDVRISDVDGGAHAPTAVSAKFYADAEEFAGGSPRLDCGWPSGSATNPAMDSAISCTISEYPSEPRPEQIPEAEPSADEADALLSGLPDPFRARATDAFVFGNALGEEYATRRLKMARCDEIH